MSGETAALSQLSGASLDSAVPSWVSDPSTISAFSEVLAKHDLDYIANRLADVVRSAFRLDVSYVCLRGRSGFHEATHTALTFQGRHPTWQHLLIEWARRPSDSSDPSSGEGGLRFFIRPIGPQAEWGFIGTACRRQDFPTPLNTMLLEFIAQFTYAVVRDRQGNKETVSVTAHEQAENLIKSIVARSKKDGDASSLSASSQSWQAPPGMTAEELKTTLKTLGLSQAKLARCISVSYPTVKKWAQGRARVPGPAALIIRLMLKHISL